MGHDTDHLFRRDIKRLDAADYSSPLYLHFPCCHQHAAVRFRTPISRRYRCKGFTAGAFETLSRLRLRAGSCKCRHSTADGIAIVWPIKAHGNEPNFNEIGLQTMGTTLVLPDPVILEAAFDRVTEFWSPKVIGRVNDHLLKVAKLKGELVWHAHDDQDELFYIVRGELRIEFESGSVDLKQANFLTVPKGVRHNPIAQEECWVLLIEPASTKHTGNEVTCRTRTLEEQLR